VADKQTETSEATDEATADDFTGILDGAGEQLQAELGAPEPDAVSADEAALRARNQRAWMASEGHILHNRHDADEWERRCNTLLAAINGHGIRIDLGTLQIGALAAAVFELLQIKGLVTEHEARAAKAKAAHEGLAQILLRVEAEADQRRQALAVAQRPKLIVPGRDG